MFDSLKKKLKSVIEKAASSIKEEKKEIQLASIEEKREEIPEAKPASMPVEDMAEFRRPEQELEKKIEDIEKSEREERKREEKLEEALETAEIVEPEEEIKEGEKTREKTRHDPRRTAEDGTRVLPDIYAPETAPAIPAPEERKRTLLDKFRRQPEEKKGLLSRIIEKTITPEDVDKVVKEIHFALLESDVAVEVAEKIEEEIRTDLTGRTVRRGKIEDTIKEALKNAMLDVMKQDKVDIESRIKEKDGPLTIMFLGFNGTGKTTTLAKLAKKMHKYKPVVAAADTFRAASIEQLEEHSKRAGFRLVKHAYGADSAAVIFDARKAAEAAGSKLVLADTAGRSHSNANLMDELRKIVRVNKPDIKILVIDSLTGNDVYEQSRLFDGAVGVDAIILTKADVYDKGGAALSAAYTIKKPIIYLGVGQEYDDLKEFDPEEIVKNLLG